MFVLGSGLVVTAGTRRGTLPAVQPNANTERAGVLRGGVLTVTLEAKPALWYLDGPARAPTTVPAFSEPGREPLMPGPLVRAPAGTEIRFSIRNSLDKPLMFLLPGWMRGATGRRAVMDSLVVAPGAVGTTTIRASAAGSYIYRATTPDGTSTAFGMAGLLTGAIVIDSAGVPTPAHDRVFVIMQTADSAATACTDTTHSPKPFTPCLGRVVFTINGRSWPNTERVHATVHDSLHWRVINATSDVHPMHLHGFYYRVDRFQSLPGAVEQRPAPGQMVVTQLMTPFSTMSMTWSPDRPGNWLFHCHFALHLQPDSAAAGPDDPYMRGMVGLAIGTVVTGRPETGALGNGSAVRHLRLVAEYVGHALREHRYQFGTPDSAPSMHYVLEENGQRINAGRDFSPELDLVRGQRVAITIVNHLDEPTSIHWHGIEIQDSYMDGVPGFSGDGKHLTPAIAPGDSFVARFAPPRAGTFMYHTHVDDVREEAGGLEGALIVREPGTNRSADDHVLFLKGVKRGRTHPLEIDGRADPDTIVLHAGRPARFRVMNLSTANPAPQVWLTARRDSAAEVASDSLLVRWRVVAKDGFDLPDAERTPEPARRIVAIGETYDFEYTPERPGALRIEFRGNNPQHGLLTRVPIRVER